MKNKACSVCKWWRRINSYGVQTYDYGHCQRHAPIIKSAINAHHNMEYHTTWPQTHENDSCGDFENESKP